MFNKMKGEANVSPKSLVLPYSKLATQPKDGKRFSNSITISGPAGTGTTSLLDNFRRSRARMPYRFLSVGGIMRTYADQLRMSIEEFGEFRQANPEEQIDIKLDAMVRSFGKQNFIIAEGRLVHVFIPHAFHVLLSCPLGIRAKRRALDLRVDPQAIELKIAERDKRDTIIYGSLYQGWDWPESDFDFVLDTSLCPKHDCIKEIATAHDEWCLRIKGRRSLVGAVEIDGNDGGI